MKIEIAVRTLVAETDDRTGHAGVCQIQSEYGFSFVQEVCHHVEKSEHIPCLAFLAALTTSTHRLHHLAIALTPSSSAVNVAEAFLTLKSYFQNRKEATSDWNRKDTDVDRYRRCVREVRERSPQHFRNSILTVLGNLNLRDLPEVVSDQYDYPLNDNVRPVAVLDLAFNELQGAELQKLYTILDGQHLCLNQVGKVLSEEVRNCLSQGVQTRDEFTFAYPTTSTNFLKLKHRKYLDDH